MVPDKIDLLPSAKKQKVEMSDDLTSTNLAPLLQLPSEILTHCFEYMNVRDLTQISSVHSVLHQIERSQIVWKSKCQSYFSLPNIVIQDANKIVIGSGLKLEQLFENIPNDCFKAFEQEDEEKIIRQNDRCIVVSKYKHYGINNILKRWSETIELLFTKIGGGLEQEDVFKLLFRYYYEMYIGELNIDIEDGCKKHCKMRKLLNQMEVYLSVHSPLIANSISFSEGHNLLDSIEAKKIKLCEIGTCFEYTQLYLLTDGQLDLKNKNYAFFGGYGFYDYQARLPLLGFDNLMHYSEMLKKSNNICLASSYPIILNSYCAVLCASQDITDDVLEVSIKKGTIYQMSGNNYPMIFSDSFSNWFETYVNNLTILNLFDFEPDGSINRFPTKNFGSETTTNGVKIYCQSLLVPELSRYSPEEVHYYFSYRIKITMDKNESTQNSCKLVSRHWEIYLTSDVQNETPEVVDGPGVVGLYPTVTPGSVFTYNSCTETEEEIGFMKGYFTMKNLKDGQLFNAMIDLFSIDINNHI
ncbi:predicted protein [Naegleria gruberi]|uniref:Predicted protein n=1 Tax=Naegleria gruberi TaxID=5762 RepID=D2W1T1_NAEGR|nr:uncharacterized protein NAEGRDRAFT_82074 [Naegleria gruberi]EFC37020.1 predicted protein [Naegleria gruberi]|eukprot:XP_002669764.1 predicted protein [Naegleria gruberi strain NEG-M]